MRVVRGTVWILASLLMLVDGSHFLTCSASCNLASSDWKTMVWLLWNGLMETATLTTLVGDLATRWPSPTYTTPTASTKSQLPFATGTRDDCSVYFDGSFFNVNGTSITSVCERAIAVLDVSLDVLEVWNPCEYMFLCSNAECQTVGGCG